MDHIGISGGGEGGVVSPAQPSSPERRYKGVRLRKWGRWVSEIRMPNSRERIWLGSYESAEKAARAFDAAAVCLRGSRGAGSLNFPESPPPDVRRRFPGAALTVEQIQGRGGEARQPPVSGEHRRRRRVVVVVLDLAAARSSSPCAVDEQRRHGHVVSALHRRRRCRLRRR
ncbi:hypothetical protein OsJ_27548 [Oryza sativa Japonica Group]|uniref:AP2/ERF domain-containing protein n=1 Tax=Oryza sativa subsp. japonica TaxID=39947 RepID=B9G185_ORYSJ|nr:hypothetical protein OsJ_27548 [Oryza sativa Japonica Group]